MNIPRLLVTGGSGFIGTNAVEFALQHGIAVCNLDIAAPRNPAHAFVWRGCDVLDRPGLRATVDAFRPTHVLHLAARTDLRETRNPEGYAANTRGVRNIVEALAATPCVRAVFASSMLVCRNGYRPSGDSDYCPDTLYGQSKVEGEAIVRSAAASYSWCIVRPTSIWGPWFAEPYRNFFEAVARGVYRRPGGARTAKALGYVGNTVWQLFRLLAVPAAEIAARVFYLADPDSLSIRDWAERIAAEFDAPRIRAVPIPFFRAAALLGDAARLLGVENPPLTTFRLRNMLTSSSFDLSPIQSIADPLPFTAFDGVRATVEWLNGVRRRGLRAGS